jgi:CBS domain-containing protein
MFRNRFFRRLFHHNLFEIDQVKLVYFLSLVVGLFSALAAALLKNAIYYIHQILTQGITRESGSYLYLAYPLIGMLLTLLFVRDLMTIPPSYLDKKENVETVMEAFRKTGAWNLPVLDNGYYVGFISKSRIYTTYHELLVEFSEE